MVIIIIIVVVIVIIIITWAPVCRPQTSNFPWIKVQKSFTQSSVFSQLSHMFRPSSRSEADLHKPAFIGDIHFYFTVEYRRYKFKVNLIFK
jgi:hypothetical protein